MQPPEHQPCHQPTWSSSHPSRQPSSSQFKIRHTRAVNLDGIRKGLLPRPVCEPGEHSSAALTLVGDEFYRRIWQQAMNF